MKASYVKILLFLLLSLVLLTGARAIQINTTQSLELKSQARVITEQNETIDALNTLIKTKELSESELNLKLHELKKELKSTHEELDRITGLYQTYRNQHDKSTDKIIYLTFDDGPSKEVTDQVLDVLKHYDIKATFFVTGKSAQANPEVLKRIASEGHAIGNHSHTHVYGTIYKSLENFASDFVIAQTIIESIVEYAPSLYRFPGGSVTAKNIGKDAFDQFSNYLWDQGVQYFDWNIDSGDASAEYVSVSAIEGQSVFQLRGKTSAIVLMHDTDAKINTVKALPKIIEAYIERGYRFDVLTPTGFTIQHR